MSQSVQLKAGLEEFDIGPVSATAGGSPAPLPGPVEFTLSGDPCVDLIPVDAVTVTARSTGSGNAVINVKSGDLSDTVSVACVATADALVVPVSAPRPIA